MIYKVAKKLDDQSETAAYPNVIPKDITAAIKLIKKKKAPGHDRILSVFVHILPGNIRK